MRTPERIVVGLAVVAAGSFFLELVSFHRALEAAAPRGALPQARIQTPHRAPIAAAAELEAIEQALTVEYRPPAVAVVAPQRAPQRAPPVAAPISVQEPEASAPVAEEKAASGGVEPQDAIRVALRQKRPRLEYCFNQELKKQAVFSGSLVLMLSVAADGRVTEAHVQEASRRESAVGACIVAQLRTLQLPRLTSDADLILPIRLEATRPAWPEALAAND